MPYVHAAVKQARLDLGLKGYKQTGTLPDVTCVRTELLSVYTSFKKMK